MENIFILLGVTLLATGIDGQTQSSGIQELATRSADFGTALYRTIASTNDDNFVISPLAASLSLASLAAGAGENTRQELLQTLKLAPMEMDTEPDRIPTLLQEMRESVAQTVASGLFISQQVQVESSFSSQVKTFYSTDVKSEDFSKVQATKESINEYVTGSTGNKIREVLDTVDPQSQLMLISAAYFTGQWKLPFNASFTQQERFYVDKYHVIQVPMMVRSDKYYLAYDPALKVGILKLPCTDGTAMLVLLPDEEVDYTSVDEALTAEVFLRWVAKLKRTKLEVMLPRFSVEYSFSLKKSLTSLGFTKFQDTGADLSGISKTSELKLSEALQKVLVEVDEQGSSSAPSSSSLFMETLPPRLTFNRPFLFLIYHEATKSLLHMGRVIDPTKK
ncbi:serpin peptidase inhibitor, clade A (alpha-1 antiproteinase, antitrypsin), member 10a isoform 1-T2 [Clarias gariepinus]|uniref:serpin peptidase inhibitor, clade A (alpha-1 antiproteinase, antitrypsin), member 10a n=1 Tax=Clarias gariepinus TaxID=13013 RepID=UPI00234E1200|nr:serpin peptidase inhibitor, clade A (alpha-1 antiproteinase, antitrypsin), member 10a [Clarias gariepinus]XP_053344552.1 serpin peptidase inhibitor, clade A (alpha-1 antiproteinase, antitrypsin), member 10a [Clarias gariepinus]